MAAARQRKQQLISNPVGINAYKIKLEKANTPSLDLQFGMVYSHASSPVMLMTQKVIQNCCMDKTMVRKCI